MAWYVNTSAFVKLVVQEEHSAAFRRWAEAPGRRLFSSDLLRTEALRTSRRHSIEALAEARDRLDVLTIVTMSTSVFDRAADLDPLIVRSLDALHLAAALTAGDDLEGVVTYDDQLVAAAHLHGLRTATPTGR